MNTDHRHRVLLGLAILLQIVAVGGGIPVCWITLIFHFAEGKQGDFFESNVMHVSLFITVFGWPLLFLISWILYWKTRRDGWLVGISCVPYFHTALLALFIIAWLI